MNEAFESIGTQSISMAIQVGYRNTISRYIGPQDKERRRNGSDERKTGWDGLSIAATRLDAL